MEFRILGPFEVLGNGRVLELGGFRQRLLLARLTVAASRVVALDALLEELWGGEPPPGAKDALQAQVSRARKALGDPARVLSRPPGYALRADPEELDAARFGALVARARGVAGDPAAAADLLGEAEALWRGPALAEFADYGFAQSESARLEDIRLEAIELRVEADLALGRHRALAGELEGLVDAHPLRERMWAQWMLALYRSGRQAEALRSYARVRRHLGDELGIEPGPELARLEEAILLHKPELDWAAPESVAPRETAVRPATRRARSSTARRLRSLRMVGRPSEQAALFDALALATAGAPSVVLVAGEAGIGKTRLVAELADHATAAGALVLAGGCASLGGSNVPYAALAEAFRRYLRKLDAEALAVVVHASEGALARVVPELGASDDDLIPNPARVHGLLLGVLGRLADAAPVVLVLEDLHWVDPSTAAVLEFVARNLTTERLLVLGTFRIDELPRGHPAADLVAALERCGSIRRLDVAPLDDAAVAELVGAIVGAESVADIIGPVRTRCQGNPLFVEELVSGDSSALSLGSTLRQMLVTRVESLGEVAAQCAQLLAVAGRPLSHALLTQAAQRGQAELLSALRQAVDRHVIAPGVDDYSLRHALVGEAVYEDLLPGERAALHAKLATALANLPAEGSAAEMARHWLSAGEAGRALVAFVRAAEAADHALACAAALAAYQQAVELWDLVPDAHERIGCDRAELLQRAAEAAHASERTRHGGGSLGSQLAVELAQAALDAVDERREPSRAGLLHARVAQHMWAAGRDGSHHADTALDLVPLDGPAPARAMVVASCARGMVHAGFARKADTLGGEASRLAASLGDRITESDARATVGTARALLGDLSGAEQQLRRALRIAQDVGFVAGMTRAYTNLSLALMVNDRVEDALTVVDEASNEADRLGIGDVEAPWNLVRRSECLRVLGRWNEAEEVLDQLDDQCPQVFFRLHERAAIAGARGDEGLLHKVLVEAAALGGDVRLEMQPLYRAQAEVALWQGRPVEARAVISAALDHLADVDLERVLAPLLLLGIRAEADMFEGHRDVGPAPAAVHAASLLERLIDLSESSAAPSSTAMTATGRAEFARMSGDDQPGQWIRAVIAWEAAGHAYPLAYARWRAAEALLVAGRPRAEVMRMVQASRVTAERLLLLPLLQRLEILGEQGKGP